MNELKPCPFCGGEVRLEQHYNADDGFKEFAYEHIQCDNCEAYFEFEHTDQWQSIAKFNTRQGVSEVNRHELMRILTAFQWWLGTEYTTLPTDSGQMTQRARRYFTEYPEWFFDIVKSQPQQAEQPEQSDTDELISLSDDFSKLVEPKQQPEISEGEHTCCLQCKYYKHRWIDRKNWKGINICKNKHDITDRIKYDCPDFENGQYRK